MPIKFSTREEYNEYYRSYRKFHRRAMRKYWREYQRKYRARKNHDCHLSPEDGCTICEKQYAATKE